MQAISQSPFAARLLAGPIRYGVSLGHGHILVSGALVLSLTPPGALRMPNGIECELPEPEPQAPIRIGLGHLESDHGTVVPGPPWDPRPSPRFAVSTYPGLDTWPLLSLAGQGPGLTPVGDDVAIGYLGACALFGAGEIDTCALATELAERTTPLSGTLLHLAAEGYLPEAAHRLLENADPEPLLHWGTTSGSGLLAGLGLWHRESSRSTLWEGTLTLPLEPPRLVRIEVQAIPAHTQAIVI
jgi:uncharacterized protein DUF2877